MADMEASVTSASSANGSGCASRVAGDKLALHSLNALRSSSVQVMGWEPFTLGPKRMSKLFYILMLFNLCKENFIYFADNFHIQWL
jgi:hypothetical protein